MKHVTTEYHGHLAIDTAVGPRVAWATFYPNGLAVHPAIGRRPADRCWTVTHVRSSCLIRSGLKRAEAFALARALAGDDFTFPKEAVTLAIADRVREAENQARQTARRAA